MSYDIGIRVKVEGLDEYVEVSEIGPNITWNVRELIKQSSGWDIENEASNGPVLPWLEKIIHGLKELETKPLRYKQYESPNGWGTVRGTIGFYRTCIEMVEEFMRDYERLLPVAVIWVS